MGVTDARASAGHEGREGDAARRSILEACGLGRRHPDGAGWLLHDVSLKVRPGDRLALVGPSGSGKTLLLRALALLDPLDAGQILWEGRPIADEAAPEFRRRVIYLHQRPSLAEGSVEDNLRLPYALKAHRGRRFDRGRIVGLLARLGRDDSFLSRSNRDLSGGEAQLAALLRAVQLDPAALLLDEPTAALDAEATGAVERLIDLWQAEAAGERAFVWITHDTDQARRMAGRMLAMRAGRLGAGG